MAEKLSIVCFDLECRPGAWYGGDFVTKIPTAAAWQSVEPRRGRVQSFVVGPDGGLEALMLAIVEQVSAADVVVGHYLTGFDLPLLNATQVRLGLPPLGDVLVQDTKTGLVKAHGISKSLENLGSLFRLRHSKVHMSVPDWERAYDLEDVQAQRRRVEGDVKLNVALRDRLLELGALGPPRVWSGSAGRLSGYVA